MVSARRCQGKLPTINDGDKSPALQYCIATSRRRSAIREMDRIMTITSNRYFAQLDLQGGPKSDTLLNYVNIICHLDSKIPIIYTVQTTLTLAIDYSQFKCAHVFENISFRNDGVSPHADCESNSVRH